jgi:hypothetical protein
MLGAAIHTPSAAVSIPFAIQLDILARELFIIILRRQRSLLATASYMVELTASRRR